LRISGFSGQPGNVMKLVFYDIIAEVIAAQRFVALALLALARKCHEMCGYVTFCEILGGLHHPPAVSPPHSIISSSSRQDCCLIERYQ